MYIYTHTQLMGLTVLHNWWSAIIVIQFTSADEPPACTQWNISRLISVKQFTPVSSSASWVIWAQAASWGTTPFIPVFIVSQLSSWPLAFAFSFFPPLLWGWKASCSVVIMSVFAEEEREKKPTFHFKQLSEVERSLALIQEIAWMKRTG